MQTKSWNNLKLAFNFRVFFRQSSLLMIRPQNFFVYFTQIDFLIDNCFLKMNFESKLSFPLEDNEVKLKSKFRFHPLMKWMDSNTSYYSWKIVWWRTPSWMQGGPLSIGNPMTAIRVGEAIIRKLNFNWPLYYYIITGMINTNAQYWDTTNYSN